MEHTPRDCARLIREARDAGAIIIIEPRYSKALDEAMAYLLDYCKLQEK